MMQLLGDPKIFATAWACHGDAARDCAQRQRCEPPPTGGASELSVRAHQPAIDPDGRTERPLLIAGVGVISDI
jgi:hypothetical protein